ncbi:DUF5302 domain-containing protein [Streptomyces sp. NPDC008313]|uniref:DUF5302 domain-containing protein n=1 Tax=Streptomyces sp. NPDC008313 TaxID=3364826 RepID=UPI0036E01C3F
MTAEAQPTEGAEPAETETEAENTSLTPDENGQYDLKRKFREALERKRGLQADGSGAGGGNGASKIRGAHGPASSQRSFRRKSGG